MADNPQHSASPSRKRPAPDDVDMSDAHATPSKDLPSSPHSSDLSTPKSISSPEDSPLPIVISAVPRQSSPAAIGNVPVTADRPAAAGSTPAKRRKLTVEEKEQQRLEKEAKAKAREEKKIQKEEEQRLKEEAKKAKAEEKKAKEEETRKKNEEKEAKKREKEAEKQKKAEEMEKKAKAQPKLSNFFSIKPTGGSTAELAHRHKSPSADPGQTNSAASASPSPQKKRPETSDYERTFLPYAKRQFEELAPENHYWADRCDADRNAAIKKLDSYAGSGSETARQEVLSLLEKRDFASLLGIAAAEQGKRGAQFPRVKEIISRLNGSSSAPVDLTEDSSEKKMRALLEELKSIPMKYIHFEQDIRPAYCGTFTKIQSERESRRMALNPFSRSLPEANYDYDSEVEWEDEGEDGEDIAGDDEDDLESDAGEDLEDFLEHDEDSASNKRRLITGDLEPISTGLLWEDNKGVLRRADGSADGSGSFSEYRMGVLLEPQPVSIDPFSTAYWESDPVPAGPSNSSTKDAFGLMNPPRLPLHARPDGMVNGANISSAKGRAAKAVNGSAAAPKPPKRMIPDDLMGEFKEAIKDSDLTKLALIEALKKRFPKVPKDAISNTLPAVAQRVGPSAAEKRWVILDT